MKNRVTKNTKMAVSVKEKARNRIQWFLPFLIAMICVILCKCLGVGNYLTNDDTSIQDFLSGQYTGSPFPNHPFIHIFLSWFISNLYMLFQGIEWWYLYSQGLMIFGMLLINYSISYAVCKKKNSVLQISLVTIIIDFCLLCDPLCRTSFTMVPAILGTGAIAFFLAFYDTGRRATVCIISYFLFVLAFCHRSAAGLALICYFLLAVFFHCVNGNDRWRRRIGTFLLAALLLISTAAGLKVVGLHYQTEINGEEYVSYNSARSEFMDYPHDSYEQNPELYKQVGWGKETAWLVEQWCFMDEHVTTDSFIHIAQNSKQAKQKTFIRKIWETYQQVQNQVMVQPTELLWLIISVFTLISILIRRHSGRLVSFLANMLGTITLIIYQLYGGRILYRTMLLCFLPSTVINLIMFVKCLGETKKKQMEAILIWLLVIAVIPVLLGVAKTVFNSENKATELERERRAEALGEFAKANPDNIYIRDTITVRDLYPHVSRPINLIDWGKPDWNSAANKSKLNANGIKKLTGDVLKRQNAFFISSMNLAEREGKKASANNRITHFYFWLKQEYGAKGIRQIEKIWDTLYVYQFVFDTDTSGKNYYDILDDRTVVLYGIR